MSVNPAIVEAKDVATSVARPAQAGAPTPADAALFQLLVTDASAPAQPAKTAAQANVPTPSPEPAAATSPPVTPAPATNTAQAPAEPIAPAQPIDPNTALGALALQTEAPTPAQIVPEATPAPDATAQAPAQTQIATAQASKTTASPSAENSVAPQVAPPVAPPVTPQAAPQAAPTKKPVSTQTAPAQVVETTTTASPASEAPIAPPPDPLLAVSAANLPVAAPTPVHVQVQTGAALQTDASPKDLPIESAAFDGKKAGGPTAATPPSAHAANAAKPAQPGAAQPQNIPASVAQSSQAASTPVAADGALPPVSGAASAVSATPDATGAQLTSRASVQSPAAMAVAQQIVRRFDGQSTTMKVRLDPPELGRVEVKLNVDRDKRVTAKIAADNPQALSELRANARELERALADAGLNVAPDGLSFDLSDQRDAQAQADVGTGASAAGDDTEGQSIPAPIAARPFGLERWNSGGVDVWA
jgi:hypothetical protein